MPTPKISEEDLRTDLKNKNEMLQRITQGAKTYANVIYVDQGERRCVLRCGNNLVEATWALDVEAGHTVVLHPETGQIIGRGIFTPMGNVVAVKRVLDDGVLEVEGHDGPKIVVMGRTDPEIEEGCRVALDVTGSIAISNLGRSGGDYARGETAVAWDDIGGLEDAKRQMMEAVELPHRFPELYKHYNQKPPAGIALKGPPGCGKTMLGKAAATAVAKFHNADVTKGLGTGFIYVKGPEVLSKWVGSAEGEIRSIFGQARTHKKKTGFPAIIFWDEADAILLKRGEGVSSDVNLTIVPQFLSEMDGIDESGAIVILATNRIDKIDPAVLRDGRVDWKVDVSRPTQDDFKNIIALNMKDRPVAKDVSREELIETAGVELWKNTRVVSIHEKKNNRVEVTLSDMATGAMAANLVSIAVRGAMRRDIIERKGKKPEGLCLADIVDAVDELHKMNKLIDHDDVLQEVLESRGPTPKVAPPTQAQRATASAA